MNTNIDHDSMSATPPTAQSFEKLARKQIAEWGINKQDRVLALSKQIAGALRKFASRYPAIRQVRINPLALMVAAAAPFCSKEELISTARVSLWIFALDDQFDEELLPHSEIIKRAGQYNQLLKQQPTLNSGDSLINALVEILVDLNRYPLFARLKENWSEAMRGTIDGMLTEHFWRREYRRSGATILPSYEEYLAVGRYSIGGPPHIWSMLVTIDDPSIPDQITHLTRMEKYASTTIRLANDLQSHTKEKGEGKFNSLDILIHFYQQSGLSSGSALQAAEEFVREDIASRMAELYQLRANPHTATTQPEAAIFDIARLVSRFYEEYDFHTADAP